MSSVAQLDAGTAASTAAAYESTQTQSSTQVYGKTIGEPQLSEKAQKYYEELKKKFSNMDFVLVSNDQRETAQQQASSYANNSNRILVLIDEEKIERMAEDEEYREKYEGIIANAQTQLDQVAASLGSTSNVKTYGIQIDDGGNASFFAVVDKSLAAQKQRIEKKAAEKKETQKAEEKKAQKKAEEEKKAEKKKNKTDKTDSSDDEVTVTASSVDELISKIQDLNYSWLSDMVQTDAEKMVGQSVDYRL
jgi:chemotaxis protein histidine kinase CheA